LAKNVELDGDLYWRRLPCTDDNIGEKDWRIGDFDDGTHKYRVNADLDTPGEYKIYIDLQHPPQPITQLEGIEFDGRLSSSGGHNVITGTVSGDFSKTKLAGIPASDLVFTATQQ
jgi:hypothetical protein